MSIKLSVLIFIINLLQGYPLESHLLEVTKLSGNPSNNSLKPSIKMVIDTNILVYELNHKIVYTSITYIDWYVYQIIYRNFDPNLEQYLRSMIYPMEMGDISLHNNHNSVLRHYDLRLASNPKDGDGISTTYGHHSQHHLFLKPKYNLGIWLRKTEYTTFYDMYLIKIIAAKKYRQNKYFRLYTYDVYKQDYEKVTNYHYPPLDIHTAVKRYTITFCPQIGITKYDIYDKVGKVKATIELSTINGKPIADFMKENKCITPFCDF